MRIIDKDLHAKLMVGLVFAFFVLLPSLSVGQDLKIKKKTTVQMPEQLAAMGAFRAKSPKDKSDSTESIIYVKGGRMRVEDLSTEYNMIGMKKKRSDIEITQCDLKRTVYFDSKDKTFETSPFTTDEDLAKRSPTVKAKGVVKLVETFTDTGERKEMFGFQARRVKSVMVLTPSDGSCMEMEMRIEKDGWYIDAPSFSCPGSGSAIPNMDIECEDIYQYKSVGKPETGIALWEMMTVGFGPMGSIKILEEAISVDRAPLPDSLFEAPAGYKQKP